MVPDFCCPSHASSVCNPPKYYSCHTTCHFFGWWAFKKKKKKVIQTGFQTPFCQMDAFPLTEWFLAHKVSSTVSDLIPSHTCWHCFLFSNRTFELVSAPKWPAWVCNALINGIVALGRLVYWSRNRTKASPWVMVIVIQVSGWGKNSCG